MRYSDINGLGAELTPPSFIGRDEVSTSHISQTPEFEAVPNTACGVWPTTADII